MWAKIEKKNEYHLRMEIFYHYYPVKPKRHRLRCVQQEREEKSLPYTTYIQARGGWPDDTG